MTWVVGARDLLVSMEQVILFIYVVIKYSKVSEHSHDTQIFFDQSEFPHIYRFLCLMCVFMCVHVLYVWTLTYECAWGAEDNLTFRLEEWHPPPLRWHPSLAWNLTACLGYSPSPLPGNGIPSAY